MVHMTILILIILLLGALLILVMVITEMTAFLRSRVPFVPTSRVDLLEISHRLPITKSDYVYDLGSGNGKVVFTIEQVTGARTKGFQYGGWTQWYAQLKKIITKSKSELISDNFFNHSWAEATVVYGYLYPHLMRSVGEKALADCKPGTKIVARDFPIPNLPLYEEWETASGHTMRLYIIE
jgi:hypothetical protein